VTFYGLEMSMEAYFIPRVYSNLRISLYNLQQPLASHLMRVWAQLGFLCMLVSIFLLLQYHRQSPYPHPIVLLALGVERRAEVEVVRLPQARRR